jgi:sulfatase maturation enzyme AslB (radical SAM superfamily)
MSTINPLESNEQTGRIETPVKAMSAVSDTGPARDAGGGSHVIIPMHLHIETINGVCTARCTMCSIASWTRKPMVMSQETFVEILTKFLPYRDHLQFLSLFLCGEPLLDKGLPSKVRVSKEMGFRSVGFASNCTELDERKSRALLEAGLDTLVCSVDGITKETHEAIRVGVNFDQVVRNILNFIRMRPLYGRAKVVVRFVRQNSNAHEWNDFKAWWERQVDPSYGDIVYAYNVTNCDDDCTDFAAKDVSSGVDIPLVCDQLSQRMIVFSNGEVALCCADNKGQFGMGNVLSEEPMKIYNNATFTHYRRMIEKGHIRDLALCKTCTVPRSQWELKQAEHA